MARLARVVVPDLPHHVTQRGVRSQAVFWSDTDRAVYLDQMRQQSERYGLSILSWCLMTNHVHFVVVPDAINSLARAMGEAHRRYTRLINFREGVRGHLFQERFFSCPLDETHAIAAIRYIERNPVRARLVPQPWEYKWSSARFHVDGRYSDLLVGNRFPFGDDISWRELLAVEPSQADALATHCRTGRPLGNSSFINHMEAVTGRKLRPEKPGPKPQV